MTHSGRPGLQWRLFSSGSTASCSKSVSDALESDDSRIQGFGGPSVGPIAPHYLRTNLASNQSPCLLMACLFMSARPRRSAPASAIHSKYFRLWIMRPSVDKALLSPALAFGVLAAGVMQAPPAKAGHSWSYCEYHYWDPDCRWWRDWYFRRYHNHHHGDHDHHGDHHDGGNHDKR
jgi:hypothetical protein